MGFFLYIWFFADNSDVKKQSSFIKMSGIIIFFTSQAMFIAATDQCQITNEINYIFIFELHSRTEGAVLLKSLCGHKFLSKFISWYNHTHATSIHNYSIYALILPQQYFPW